MPTFHVHEMRLPRFGYKPAALDGPLLYSTVIEQVAFLESETFNVAYEPALIGDVTWTRRTRAAAVAGRASARTATIVSAIRFTAAL